MKYGGQLFGEDRFEEKIVPCEFFFKCVCVLLASSPTLLLGCFCGEVSRLFLLLLFKVCENVGVVDHGISFEESLVNDLERADPLCSSNLCASA